VRFWAPDLGHKKTRATLFRWSDSAVAFTVSADQREAYVPFQGLERMEVYGGKNHWKGALIGATLGGAVGTLVGMAVGNSAVEGCSGFMCELEAMNYMVVGGLIGTVIGTPFGVLAAPDRWQRVNLPTDMGFPPHRTPWHRSTAFQVFTGVAAALLLIATNGSG